MRVAARGLRLRVLLPRSPADAPAARPLITPLPGTYQGAAGFTGSACTQCTAGSFCGARNMTAPTPCNAGTFSAAGAAACTLCPPGFTSGEGSASCPSECSHPNAPASCLGVYTFAAGATSGCYFGAYATLTGGAWVANSSFCTECALGDVSVGWASTSDVAGAAACINTTLVIAAVNCTGTTANVTFRGGEQRAGVAPSNHGLGSDIFDGRLEVNQSNLIGGTASAATCTASATQDGVFTCTGLAPDEGNKCVTDGAAPVGSLTVGASATFTCAGAGVAVAVFTGGNYVSITQASPADLAFISAFTAPASVVTPNATFYPDPAGHVSPQLGYCYLATPASSNVTCYGYKPADGFECASATGAAPTPCTSGTYSNAAQPASLGGCLACGPSTYSAAAGATSCAACPAGSSSETANGNDAVSTCIVSPGFYISGTPDVNTPIACVAGSYCLGSGRVGVASAVGTAASPLPR
jgi:syndecan 4